MMSVRIRGKGWRLVFACALLTSVPLVGGLLGQALLAPPSIINAPTEPLLHGFRWRSIGPAGQGGRIDDLAVDERNPSTYYIGFAVSGVWKTTNNGTTFQPIFDTYGVSSIGDLAIAPSDPNVLYVGTGEANNRQTSSVGNGLWKSTDAGAHFTHVGLADSQSIARIVIHPRNPDVVWVAVAGHLYGPNVERGVFMTTDGGRTWTKTLYVNQDTGATDLIDQADLTRIMLRTGQPGRTTRTIEYLVRGTGEMTVTYDSLKGGKAVAKIAVK